jgi:hypothetical protein
MFEMRHAIVKSLSTSCAALTALAWPAAAWAAKSGVTIVKEPGKATDAVSPMTSALIQFGVGTAVIAVLVFMINMILMKGMRVNPLASSRFSVLGGLLAIYALFAVLFTPVFPGGLQIMMYIVVVALGIGSVFVLVNQKA